jgi:molybdopterin converting factor small subunit
MIVRLKLFAVAKELAGRDELSLDLPAGATIADLRQAAIAAVPALAKIIPYSLCAIDTSYAADNTPIDPHSEIALIPPVSGG